MKKRWIYFILFLLVLFGITLYFLTRPPKEYKHYDFPENLVVHNYTNYRYIDTMALIVLNKIFDYDTMEVIIYYMPYSISLDNIPIIGHIIKNPFEDNYYLIYVERNLSEHELKRLISHELIHLKQMEDGDLIPLFYTENVRILYKGDTIYFKDVPYDKRPYEIDAYREDGRVLRRLNRLLYKK